MPHFKTALLLIICVNSFATCARILAVMPTPSYSHQIVFRPLWRELSRRHQVVLLTTDPVNDTSLTNITEIDLHFAYDLWNIKYEFTRAMHEYQSNFLKVAGIYLDMMHEIMDEELSNVHVQKLIKNETETFDLVMVEYLHPTMMAFSARYGCPFIGVVPLDALGLAHENVGNPTHPALYPDFTLPFGGELNFFERLFSAFHWVWIRLYTWRYLYPLENETIKKHFGENTPDLRSIERNISMLFLNINYIFHPIRPLVPSTISIGGGGHLNPGKPLSKELQEYLDEAKEGVVYFCLGSNIKSKDLSTQTRQAIIETFADLPYKVLWKYENDLQDLPINVKINKWLPQQDVLRHPNIKLFITQGGLQSMEEAISSNVPILAMPFFADQLPNVKNMVSKGLGLFIDFHSLTKNAFKNAILEIINNSKYKVNVQKWSKIVNDRELSGIEQGVWWTEHVIQHKGASHLRSPTADLPLYKYFFVDAILAVILSCIVFYFAVAKILRFIRLRVVLWTSRTENKIKSH